MLKIVVPGIYSMSNSTDWMDEFLYTTKNDHFLHSMYGCMAASAVGSFAVIVTGFVFYEKMTANKLFMKLIMMVSGSDFIASSIGWILGEYKMYLIFIGLSLWVDVV